MLSAGDSNRTVNVLLVEDSPSDAGLTTTALQQAPSDIKVHLVEDGEAAMQFLRRVEPFGDAPLPDLVLLDLNMPKKDGREVLAEIRDDPELANMPVIVLTTSSAPEDIRQTYQLRANCYVQKPVDLDEFLNAVKSLDQFWFQYATLPPK